MKVVASLLTVSLAQRIPDGKLCRPSDAEQGGCKVDGSSCEGERVEFQARNLTLDKWDNSSKTYSTVGILESHARIGQDDTWQMYLHGPMIRPAREIEDDANVPPFYVSATFNNKVYRFDHVKRQGRGQPLIAQQKMVANAVAPSTAWPIEDEDGKIKGLLMAEGQPFLINSLLNKSHEELWFGGVDYLSKDADKCDLVYPNKKDEMSHRLLGDVVNTVSCQPENGICFFTVWNFYDDQFPIWQAAHAAGVEDCLHYCVMESMDGSASTCTKAGVVKDETGEPICSKPGQGATHGMTVAHLDKDDATQFDIFLVFTGGATFDAGESSLRKVRCQRTADGDLAVLRSEIFGRDLFEGTVGRNSTFGSADHDVGGDHAWPDASGKYLWVSTFRVGNPGVHMLDYETGELIYSIHGMSDLVPRNYAYSAGIHGIGSLGTAGSNLVVGTSACALTKACAPVPYTNYTPSFLEAKGIMYIIDLSEIMDAATELMV